MAISGGKRLPGRRISSFCSSIAVKEGIGPKEAFRAPENLSIFVLWEMSSLLMPSGFHSTH